LSLHFVDYPNEAVSYTFSGHTIHTHTLGDRKSSPSEGDNAREEKARGHFEMRDRCGREKIWQQKDPLLHAIAHVRARPRRRSSQRDGGRSGGWARRRGQKVGLARPRARVFERDQIRFAYQTSRADFSDLSSILYLDSTLQRQRPRQRLRQRQRQHGGGKGWLLALAGRSKWAKKGRGCKKRAKNPYLASARYPSAYEVAA